jgi:hypothetical protein
MIVKLRDAKQKAPTSSQKERKKKGGKDEEKELNDA